MTVLALIYFSLIFFSETGWRNQRILSDEISIQTKKNDSLQTELDVRVQKIQRLNEDSFYMEKAARTKFGMSKEGEVGFEFVSKP